MGKGKKSESILLCRSEMYAFIPDFKTEKFDSLVTKISRFE